MLLRMPRAIITWANYGGKFVSFRYFVLSLRNNNNLRLFSAK